MDISRIKFGTDGWRGVIADDFTFENVRACAQGVAGYHLEQGLSDQPLVVGYDTRFASEEFAVAVAEVLAGNGIPVLLCDRPAPTPVVSCNIVARRAAAGVVITASHNPGQWNGFKYRTGYGGCADPDLLSVVEDHIHRVGGTEDVKGLSLPEARTRGLIQEVDPEGPFLEQINRILDVAPVRDAGLRVVVDSMHGAGAGYIPRLIGGGKTWVREIRAERNPAFPGMHNPEPVAHNLEALSQTVVTERANVGLAMDGDADRVGVVDEAGKFITTLQVYALLAYYLLEVRGLRGPLIKSITVGAMPHRLGEIYGVPVHETAVGFKYIAPLMAEGEALLGGEESGGYAFRGHLPERDGVLSGLMILDLMAQTGKRISELVEELYRLVGPHYFDRLDVPFSASHRSEVQQRMAKAQPVELAELRVMDTDTLDGFRFHLQGGAWVIVRFSGTEPLLRIYAEAETPERVQALLTAARSLAQV